MRFVVSGATGMVGRHVVQCAGAAGHTVVPLSRSTGQDVGTGAGLAAAMAGADAVIDVSNVTTAATKAAVAFFTGATQHLLDAERASGVRHHVALSIVGIDGQTSGYYAGKLAQEELLAASPAPWTLLRATQFHEFVPQMVGRTGIGPVVVIPAMRTSTVAAAEVAEALVRLAEGEPQARARDLGGPGEDDLADLVRRWLAATGTRKKVLRVPVPGSFGRLMRSGGLVAGADADHGRQTFAEWLAQQ